MEKIQIGTVLRPQGIRGELKVLALTDHASRFEKLHQVFVGENFLSVKIMACRTAGENVFLTLAGIADRNAAEGLRGKGLFVDRKDAAPLPQDAFYIVDILGCEVVTESGKALGLVKDILQHGAADVYVLDNGTMFPFLKDVALEVDPAAKRIVVCEKRFNEVSVHED